MRKYTIEFIWRVRLQHVPGRLAKLATAIAEEGGLLGEISTEHIGEQALRRSESRHEQPVAA